MVHAVISNKELYINRFKSLFQTLDCDNSGFVTKGEFEQVMDEPLLQAFFASLEIDASDALNLFQLLESDIDHINHTEEGIEMEDFVMGCLRLKGHAKSCDMALLMRDMKSIHRELRGLALFVEDQFGCTITRELEDRSAPSEIAEALSLRPLVP